MPIEIAAREQEGIEILDLRGRLTFGDEDLQLREELEKLVRGKKTKVVMNLHDLHQIDTTGFGTLLFAQETLRAAGGGLAVAGLKPAHIEVLMKARLEVVFDLFEDDQSAVNSFIPGRVSARYDILQFVRSHALKPKE
jgi:anti-sigma B factor antagonist